jgi:phosphoglycolate phosphatase-like HAD superfamily hydrolase
MKYLFLFDIDGTILNFQHGVAKSLFIELMTEVFGEEFDESHLPDFNGRTDLFILRKMAENRGVNFEELKSKLPLVWDAILRKFERYSTPDYIDLLPGVDNLLKSLLQRDDVDLGLITGNFRANAYLKLKAHDLHNLFHFGAFGDDHENRNYLPPIAINKANVYHNSEIFNSANTLIIGDTLRDIECAKYNNIKSVAVCTGRYSYEELQSDSPDLIYNDFSDYKSVENSFFNLFE